MFQKDHRDSCRECGLEEARWKAGRTMSAHGLGQERGDGEKGLEEEWARFGD